jgi:2-polyprenyl-3-methyl-5-hydroxy-6-metoxy-1,4-benzoquinol methylase
LQSKTHWENVYTTKATNEVSWFQEHAALSQQFIQRAESRKESKIIDVGGGASILVDELLSVGYKNITVLDISEKALETARHRLGNHGHNVTWLVADITTAKFPHHNFDVWHDRAVFHFLTDPKDRELYIKNVLHSVKAGGHVIVATFSLNGPAKCSGLEVVRYNPETLHGEFGENFNLIDHVEEKHKTPFGTEQQFIYCFCKKA